MAGICFASNIMENQYVHDVTVETYLQLFVLFLLLLVSEVKVLKELSHVVSLESEICQN